MAELAATPKVVLGSVAFAIFWVLAVFPAVPLLPIGRTAGALLSAMLMVLFGVMTPEDAYAAIDLPILALLFATMVVSAYLEQADLFTHLGKLLSWKSKGRKDLLCRICLVSAVASALFTNDTCCVVLTGFVLKLARQNNLPPRPFLLALASSANIGSAATPIGNPQNLIIATQSHISFGKFVLTLLPAMLVGVLVNAGILLLHYWKQLSVAKDVETNEAAADYMFAGEEVTSHRFSPATMSHVSSMNLEEWIGEFDSFSRSLSLNGSGIAHAESTLRNRAVAGATAAASPDEAQDVISIGTESTAPAENSPFEVASDCGKAIEGSSVTRSEPDLAAAASGVTRWARRMTARWNTRHLWRACVYLVTVGMLFALLMGLNMSWTALTAALVLIVLDFKDAQPCLEKVSYSLLIFFCGMFITVAGFNKTGLPGALWEAMEPHARIDRPSGIAVLGAVVLLLSNIASNVPTVLLLGAQVAASAARISQAQETKAWLVLAWVSTVAGNLTLLGSAANLIVCEQAQREKSHGYNLSFFAHLRFGFLSTLVVTAVGLLLIRS